MHFSDLSFEKENPSNLIQGDGSRKASNKGEKGEGGDEKKLESVGRKSEGVFRKFNIVTRSLGDNLGSGRSGQESRDGGLLLALKLSKTIVEDEFLGLWGLAGLGSLLVVEIRDRSSVDGRVEEDRLNVTSSGSTGDLSASKLEVLCLLSERRVSLAGRRSIALRVEKKHSGTRTTADKQAKCEKISNQLCSEIPSRFLL